MTSPTHSTVMVVSAGISESIIVYTSNIFAILGLRSLYFALAALMHRFVYLKYALALVLIFIGCKIFYHGMVGKVPALLSLGVTFGLLLGGVVISLIKTRGQKKDDIVDGHQPHAIGQEPASKREKDTQLGA